MAPKPSNLPRKRPRQRRSRATVEALLDAAARVLVEEGFEGATTNRIAAVAGASVGSLYQYFPNKEAIVRALLERHVAELGALRPPQLAQPDLPLRERVRLAVGWYLAAHAADPALHQVLTAHAHQVVGAEAVRAFERAAHATLRAILEPYREQLRPRNLEVAAFAVVQCLEALTHGAVVHHPELLGSPELAGEMTQLVAGYLEADGSG